MGNLLPDSLSYSLPGLQLWSQILLAAIDASSKVKVDTEL